MEQNSSKASLFGWADTPWLVAALLGAWGVMIGLEDFLLADIFIVAAGALVCVRVAKETSLWKKERRLLVFIGAFVGIMVIIGLDLRWTNRKGEESKVRKEQLSHLGEIPALTNQLGGMRAAQAADKNAEALVQAKANQKLDDIEGENKALRKSVETKDAALVQIARDQYALNFFPQVLASAGEAIGEIRITNNGKTNINLQRIDVEGVAQDTKTVPALIVSQSNVSFKLSEEQRRYVAVKPAIAAGDRIPIECRAYLLTLDKKHYALDFTWFFKAKDGVLTEGNVIDHPITEIKQP